MPNHYNTPSFDVLSLVPAYGRVYSMKETMKKDWEDGKDFQIYGGPYCSIRDVERMKDMGYKKVILYTSVAMRLVKVHGLEIDL